MMTLDWMMLGPRHGAGNSRCRSVVGGKIPSSIHIMFFSVCHRENSQLSNKAHECGQSCDNISTIKTFLRHRHLDFLLLLGKFHVYTRNGSSTYIHPIVAFKIRSVLIPRQFYTGKRTEIPCYSKSSPL